MLINVHVECDMTPDPWGVEASPVPRTSKGSLVKAGR